jgi:5'-nucleotidase
MSIESKNKSTSINLELFDNGSLKKRKMKRTKSLSKKDKKILYIDMDGVVADFWKAIKINQPRIDDENFFPTYADKEKEVDAICERNPHIFRYLIPIKDAIESTKPLFKNYDVYFLSTPMWEIPESYTDKRLWLENYYGNLAKKRLILTNRKDLVIGDILIDDRLKNGSQNFKGKFIHFGTKEFPDWKAVVKYLNSEMI